MHAIIAYNDTPFFLPNNEEVTLIIVQYCALTGVGHGALLPSRNNSAIRRISEIIGLLLHLFHLLHYYFD